MHSMNTADNAQYQDSGPVYYYNAQYQDSGPVYYLHNKACNQVYAQQPCAEQSCAAIMRSM